MRKAGYYVKAAVAVITAVGMITLSACGAGKESAAFGNSTGSNGGNSVNTEKTENTGNTVSGEAADKGSKHTGETSDHEKEITEKENDRSENENTEKERSEKENAEKESSEKENGAAYNDKESDNGKTNDSKTKDKKQRNTKCLYYELYSINGYTREDLKGNDELISDMNAWDFVEYGTGIILDFDYDSGYVQYTWSSITQNAYSTAPVDNPSGTMNVIAFSWDGSGDIGQPNIWCTVDVQYTESTITVNYEGGGVEVYVLSESN